MTDLSSASIPDLQRAIDAKTESRVDELRAEKARLIERLYAIEREMVGLVGVPHNAQETRGEFDDDHEPGQLSVRGRVLATIEAAGEPIGPVTIGMRTWPELSKGKAQEKAQNAVKALAAEGAIESTVRGLWRIKR